MNFVDVFEANRDLSNHQAAVDLLHETARAAGWRVLPADLAGDFLNAPISIVITGVPWNIYTLRVLDDLASRDTRVTPVWMVSLDVTGAAYLELLPGDVSIFQTPALFEYSGRSLTQKTVGAAAVKQRTRELFPE